MSITELAESKKRPVEPKEGSVIKEMIGAD